MDPLRSALLAGLGAISYGQEKLKDLVSTLIDKGELTREQGEQVISEWVKKGEEEKDSVADRVTAEMQKVLQRLQMVTRDEFDALAARVEALENERG
ncbi:MAG: phasin family protein [Planctomycetes bacterium]|nr:phasin family protein [Planctomycetota bacterium]